jgi:hypothetical protein
MGRYDSRQNERGPGTARRRIAPGLSRPSPASRSAPVVSHHREEATECALALVTVLPTQAARFREADVHHSLVAESRFRYEDRGGRRGA